MRQILADYAKSICQQNIEKPYALVYRHIKLVHEATKRGYNFKDLPNSTDIPAFNVMPESWDNQEKSLSGKECDCIKMENLKWQLE